MNEAEMTSDLAAEAVAIWRAGVQAVDAARLVLRAVVANCETLRIAGESLSIADIGRLVVVGAGKAGAGMAAGFEDAVKASPLFDRLIGWVNVPDDCVRPLQRIHLHGARPAGHNEPTEAGVFGTLKILKLVSELSDNDVCVVLLSGGGSALLPAPVEGITLAHKQQVTRLLMHAGARIDELNCVRTQLSRVKGGRLAEACRAGRLICLIISDVIGDPLSVIASGPTEPSSTTAEDALGVLQRYHLEPPDVPASVFTWLTGERPSHTRDHVRQAKVKNAVIGNIDVALTAAAAEARSRGYRVQSLGGANAGIAQEVGIDLAERCLRARDEGESKLCFLSGGEPVVRLSASDRPRAGGRNQELVLAAAQRLWEEDARGIVVLSGGTDGEDGPTDAAGAWVDIEVLQRARGAGLHPSEFLAINNSYAFFTQVGGHLKTGPTHTNVMDVRVALVTPTDGSNRPGKIVG